MELLFGEDRGVQQKTHTVWDSKDSSVKMGESDLR